MAEEEIYYEEEGWRKKFEGVLPLILLLLIVGVILWKTNILYSIPGIGDLLRPKVVSVLVIGNDADILRELDSMKTELQISYSVWQDKDIELTISPDRFKGYDIIILTESIGKNGTLPHGFLLILKEYLATSNAKLVVYGLAGSRAEEKGNILNGWFVLRDYLPMDCPRSICDESMVEPYSKDEVILIKRMDHPALKDVPYTVGFESQYVKITRVNAVSGASSLMIVKNNRTGETLEAVLERSWGVLGGKTIYLAFHPKDQTLIFKDVIRYLAGR